MIPAILLAAVIGGVTAVASELVFPPKGDHARARAKAAADRVGELMGWEHFECYVDRVGWRESRWNPRGGGRNFFTANRARGMFGIRPETAREGDYFPDTFPLWGPPEMQVALLASLVQRSIDNQGGRSWLDARAWMAYPYLADETAEEYPRRAETELQWQKARIALGACPGIDSERLEPGKWPGAPAVIAAAMNPLRRAA